MNRFPTDRQSPFSWVVFSLALLIAFLPDFWIQPVWSQNAEDASPSSAEPLSLNVESITQDAMPSVVVISHIGRDDNVEGVGSGFVIDKDGLVATSLHVIGEARPIQVRLNDGRRFRVTEIHATDRQLDLAVIRIDAKGLKPLSLGDSDQLKQGSPVVALGNPQGLEHSVVSGVVSAVREFNASPMFQLAIPIEPGNSGGPLLDRHGQVQGILAMKSALSDNLGFALPINALKPLLRQPNPIPMDRWLTIGSLDPGRWKPVGNTARWSQKAGRVRVEGAGEGFGGRSICLFQGSLPERPYECAVTVKLDDESGAAGIAFAADGQDRHYGFYPSSGRLRLTRFEGPDVFSWTILDQVQSPHYRLGEWNRLKVRWEPDRIVCYVNGRQVIESNDPVLSHAHIGLVKFRQTRAQFKDFEVAPEIADKRPSAELISEITGKIEDLNPTNGWDSALLKDLQSDAQAARTVLWEQARRLERQASLIRRLAGEVHDRSVQSQLVDLLEQTEPQIDLAHAALLIAKLDNPDVDIPAYLDELDRMAEEIRGRLPERADAEARLAVLNQYLFQENGYHGSRTDFYNQANSYLNEVIDDREGIPITLSVLHMELARRIGLDSITGIPMPNHFIVAYQPESEDRQLLDVFNGGKAISRDEAEELAGESLSNEELEPAGKKQIVVRMLRNLVGIAMRQESNRDILRYLDVLIAINPDAAIERWSRGMFRLRQGNNDGAREDFKWLLDHRPAEVDLDRVLELYRSIE